jgi:FAD/FMN-containing dehydrogenase
MNATAAPTVTRQVLDRIAQVVGPRGMITDPAEIAPYMLDERREFPPGRAAAVVRPASTDEVSRVVAICNETRTAIVPQGGNTGLTGASIPHPDGGEIVLSVKRMNRVRDIDPLNYTITVDAGVVLADVQKAAAEADRLFPLSLGGEGTAVIGGNVSTNAGGTGVLRYGNARELVLGLEVVLPDGRVWDGLGRLRKDNTGYDLKQLFIGAEGTLGIVTAVVLKLYPKPRDIQTAFVAVASPQAALELLALARAASDDRVTGFEWIPRLPLDYVLMNIPGTRDPLPDRHDHYVLVELTSAHDNGQLRTCLEEVLARGMERGLVRDAALAESRAQAADFWKIRETVPESQKPEGISIRHDVAVPVSQVPVFLERANRAVAEAVPGIRICSFGHLGDGNVHYNLTQPKGADGAAYGARKDEINRLVYDQVLALGGSISAEHGIGRQKRHLLPEVKPPAALDMMRQIKRALDPNGIMNPGKLL